MFGRALKFILVISFLFSQAGTVSASPKAPLAALPDPSADRVLGQAAFDTNGGGTSAESLWLPAGIAIAPPSAPNAGRIFVTEYGDIETGNHRVLSWPSAHAFANGQAADLVIGQDDFDNRGGGLGADHFWGPEAAVVDGDGNLWVADTENHRVLRFNYPLYNGMDASIVLGQADFDHNGANQGLPGPQAYTLYWPRGLALDPAGSLWVADDNNNRVLGFGAPFTNGMSASVVIGQNSYTGGEPNAGGSPSQYTLNRPKGLAMDAAGNLYVAEYENNRVMRFSPPLYSVMPASNVYGQFDFSGIFPNRGLPMPENYTLSHPVDIAVSSGGDVLYVTDQGNVRVLAFSNPLNDVLGAAIADQVYGQPDFNSTTPNNGGISASSINYEPLGLAVDAFGDLYHADFQNNRVLAYDTLTQVVGNGSMGSCTEAALDAALATGGRITFDCGTAQINLSTSKGIHGGVLLDGGGAITLSGQDANNLFYISNVGFLILRNIILTDGYSNYDGGAIYNDFGALVLENCTIRDSVAGLSGGAVVSYGAMTITDSLLEGNQALNGGALYPRWGGAVTTIVNSVLRDNHATDTTDGLGGALLAWDGAPVTIKSSVIENNTARLGGGIYNFAVTYVYLENTTLRGNTATASGGAIYNVGVVSLAGVTLNGNTASESGGAMLNLVGANMLNSTLSGNTAVVYGGGLANYGQTYATNVTLSGNSAGSGGAIYNNDLTAQVLLSNSIAANSPSGGNCGGASLTTNNADLYSLSSDLTCTLAGIGSQNNVDPLLTQLGDYGGPTQVHLLEPGSPAIDAALGGFTVGIDQRGVLRPQGGGYDIGAVEVTESDFVKKVFLPLTILEGP